MNNQQFDKCVEAQLLRCEHLLLSKGEEYAWNADRLRHFKKAAGFTNGNSKQALFGMMLKHLVSLSDMCEENTKVFPLEKWEEKITDSINYLLLLYAIVCEEAGVNTDEII